MAKFTLESAITTRHPHYGLMTKAYYKRNPSDPYEASYCINVFNRCPTVIVEAEVIEYPLGGIFEYEDGKRVDRLVLFCPKTQDGLFCMGFSPAEQAARVLKKLKKVEV